MPDVTNTTENKVLDENNNISFGKIYRRCKETDSQMLRTNTSLFASAKSLATYLYLFQRFKLKN